MISRSSLRLQNVFTLKVGVIGEDLINADTGSDLSNDHANRDAHAADAGSAAHHLRTLSDAVKIGHFNLRLAPGLMIALSQSNSNWTEPQLKQVR
jgi:hypothetical protein